MKCCKKCNETKILSDFHKSKMHKLGVRDICKKCVALYMKSYGPNKRKTDERWRRLRDDNPYGVFFYNLRNPFSNFSL